MKKITCSSIQLLCFLCIVISASAKVRLPAILGSHMVLQQKATVIFWGWCDPGEKVSVQPDWDTATYHATGLSTAKWELQLHTPAAGGPYKIKIMAQDTILLEDVLVGEVWVGSGQSNMEMSYSWGVKEYTADMDNGNNQQIRLFHIPRLTANYPQDDTRGSWVVCNTADLKRFSLVAYFFGLRLQQQLQVPVGLINTSWGGTPAEVWTPKDTILTQPVLKQAASQLKPFPGWPIEPGITYNAMIDPITKYNIAGVLWYQGEANVGTATTYRLLLSTMINCWRKAWNKELPFFLVQIAPFAGYGNSVSSSLLREAEVKTMSVPHTGMVVITDLVDNINDIHPHNKKDVGLRLAGWALAEVYGQTGFAYKSPLYNSMEIKKDRIWLSFDNASKGLMSKGDTLTEFYIAGDDKHFVPAQAKIEGNRVQVWSKAVKTPVAVRFGFTSAAMPNLFSKEGLPVAGFRTDDWEVDTVPAPAK